MNLRGGVGPSRARRLIGMTENVAEQTQFQADLSVAAGPVTSSPAPGEDAADAGTDAAENEESHAPQHDLLVRGESAIARGGMVLAALLIAAMATSGWWTLQT